MTNRKGKEKIGNGTRDVFLWFKDKEEPFYKIRK
jgi:hypothetical protein